MRSSKGAFAVELTSHVPEVKAKVAQAMRRKVVAMGIEARATMTKEVLVGTRTGRWAKVPGTSTKYRQSRSGEAPARRLGDLPRSYKPGRVEGTPHAPRLKFGSNLIYAPVLELKLNRPHLSTTLELCRPKFREILAGDWGI